MSTTAALSRISDEAACRLALAHARKSSSLLEGTPLGAQAATLRDALERELGFHSPTTTLVVDGKPWITGPTAHNPFERIVVVVPEDPSR